MVTVKCMVDSWGCLHIWREWSDLEQDADYFFQGEEAEEKAGKIGVDTSHTFIQEIQVGRQRITEWNYPIRKREIEDREAKHKAELKRNGRGYW